MSFRSSPDCPSLKPTPTWACGPADHQGGLHTNADGRATHRFIGSSALIEHIKQTLISQSDRVPLFVCLFFCLFVCLLVGWLVGLLVWFGFSNLWRLFPCFCCCCKTGFHWVSRQSVLRSMSQCSTPTTTASLADCGSRHPRSTIIHHPIHLPSSFPPLLLLLHFRLLFNNAHPLSSLPRTRLWLSSLKSRSFYLSFSFFLSIYPSIHPSLSISISLSLSYTPRISKKDTCWLVFFFPIRFEYKHKKMKKNGDNWDQRRKSTQVDRVSIMQNWAKKNGRPWNFIEEWYVIGGNYFNHVQIRGRSDLRIDELVIKVF